MKRKGDIYYENTEFCIKILTKEEIKILKHSLGLDRAEKIYRNYYAIGEGEPAIIELEHLIELGLMVKYRDPYNDFGGMIYHVTAKGKKIIMSNGGKEWVYLQEEKL